MRSFYQPRREISPEETAANAARREARSRAAMHCQCCGRAILANGGVIAHHGYQRPGEGWQTGSCIGARQLPFEVSRDALGQLIARLTEQLEDACKRQVAIANETAIFSVTFADTRLEKVWNHRRQRNTHPMTTVIVTRKTFELVRNANHEAAEHRSFPYSFDDVKKDYARAIASEVSRLGDWLEECNTRYSGWKQTHQRKGKEWQAL